MKRARVIAHVHSEWSDDAALPLEYIARSFARIGADVLLMCEHDRGFSRAQWVSYQKACSSVSSSRLLVVPGIEYQDSDNIVHIPVWGQDIPFLGKSRATMDLLQAVDDVNGVAVFAHPGRRKAYLRYRNEWAPFLSGVEVWNRKYDGVAPNSPSTALGKQESLPFFVSLDFHTRRQMFPLFTTVDIDGPLSVGTVVEALRAGHFHPSLLGIPVERFLDGPLNAMARLFEYVRQHVVAYRRAV